MMDSSRTDSGRLMQGQYHDSALFWPSDRHLFRRRRFALGRVLWALAIAGSAALLAWGLPLLR